jgi:hypothetical protein
MANSESAGAVVPLKTYKLAKRAVGVLVGLLHDPPWLVRVAVEIQPDGDPVVVGWVRKRTRAALMCFPSSVDGIRVQVREVEHAEHGEGGQR